MLMITGLDHMTVLADNEKICVNLTSGNKKAAVRFLDGQLLFPRFLLGFAGTVHYCQLLFTVSLHELRKSISSCK